MYITNLEDLKPAIAERIGNRKKIHKSIDSWIKKKYGIENFMNMTKGYFRLDEEKSYLTLCRQIPSVRTEDISCHIGAKILGYPLLSLPFLDDTFSTSNHEKRSYLHFKWASYGRKKVLYFEGERIVDGSINDYAGFPLSRIKTSSHIQGEFLHDFHFDLRDKVFGENNGLIDVSELDRTYVRESSVRKRPKEVYSIESDISKRKNIKDINILDKNYRPASDWYYPLYFSWFLDGSMVLLETYDNDLAEVSQAKKLFESTVQLIESGTGLRPLVLKIPPLDEKMLCLQKCVISCPDAIENISQRFIDRASGDSTEFFTSIAEAVIDWHP